MSASTHPDLLSNCRGELVTAREAEEILGVARGTVDAWVSRGHLDPAVRSSPRLFWTDDLYDCHYDRNSPKTRRGDGKFARRITPL